MIIAAAQTHPARHNTEANIATHLQYISTAAAHGVELLVFPEMSLTGYELDDARALAFIPNDSRLDRLQQAAIDHNITVVCGAPVLIDTALHIGAFILSPDGSREIYTKQFLHPGEEAHFSPNLLYNPLLSIGEEKVSIAICADITNPLHPKHAAEKATSLYLASIFYTPKGITEAYEQLSRYAQEYEMNIIMSNYTGPYHAYDSAGKSAYWDSTGALIGSLSDTVEGLLIINSIDNSWTQAAII